MTEAPCRLLDWDTAFWGLPVARVKGSVLTEERCAAVDDWAATPTSRARTSSLRATSIRRCSRGEARISSEPSGAQEYQDHGAAADINVHSTAVLAVVCRKNRASVFGKATINGSGSYNYRIDLTDNGEPGAGNDRYRIRLSTGYDSGPQILTGGNIQMH